MNDLSDDGGRSSSPAAGAGAPLDAGWPAPAPSGAGDEGAVQIPPAELAAAIAQALRELGPPGQAGAAGAGEIDASGVGAATWALVAVGAALGAIAALVLGAALGLALGGYLAAPNRAVEIIGGALALLGGARAVLRLRRAVRTASWGMLAGAALDFALALCAAALAAGMRP